MGKTKKEPKDYLKHWRMTTLHLTWFKEQVEPRAGNRVEWEVWYPPGISDEERTALLARHAAKCTALIRQLTGTSKMIVQSQGAEVVPDE